MTRGHACSIVICMDRSNLSPQDQADGLDTCACGAKWSGDDLSHCPGCGRDLDIEITISHCEQEDARREGFTGALVIGTGERAIWRASSESWHVGPIGEEQPATAFAADWLDALDAHILLQSGGEPDEEDATP